MRTHMSFGILGLALAVGMLWPSEANAQYRPRPGVGMLAPPPHAPRMIGGYSRPMTPPRMPPRMSPSVSVFSQYPTPQPWNFNQYAPFFPNYGYNNFYPMSYPVQAFTPYYYPSAAFYRCYGNGYYFPY